MTQYYSCMSIGLGMHLYCTELLSVDCRYLKTICVPRMVVDIFRVLIPNLNNVSESCLIPFGHPFDVKIDVPIKNRNRDFLCSYCSFEINSTDPDLAPDFI